MTVRSWGQRGLEERPLQTTWSCQKQKPCLQRTDCSRHRRPVIIAYFSVPSGISEDSIKTQPTTATTDALMNLKVKQCTKGDKVQNQLLAEKTCEKKLFTFSAELPSFWRVFPLFWQLSKFFQFWLAIICFITMHFCILSKLPKNAQNVFSGDTVLIVHFTYLLYSTYELLALKPFVDFATQTVSFQNLWIWQLHPNGILERCQSD